jgi:hypothetical protein
LIFVDNVLVHNEHFGGPLGSFVSLKNGLSTPL